MKLQDPWTRMELYETLGPRSKPCGTQRVLDSQMQVNVSLGHGLIHRCKKVQCGNQYHVSVIFLLINCLYLSNIHVNMLQCVMIKQFSRESSDRRTDRRMDGRYQPHYLPASLSYSFYQWAALREKVPNGLSWCHTKRRTCARAAPAPALHVV